MPFGKNEKMIKENCEYCKRKYHIKKNGTIQRHKVKDLWVCGVCYERYRKHGELKYIGTPWGFGVSMSHHKNYPEWYAEYKKARNKRNRDATKNVKEMKVGDLLKLVGYK